MIPATTTTAINKTVNKAEIIAAFINDIDAKPNSRKLYARTLKQFFEYIAAESLPLDTITRANILNYKQALLNKGLASLTVGSYLVVVRKFYAWAEANKLYPNVAKEIKTPPRSQQFKKEPLTVAQVKKLLKHIKSTNKRDFALINLLVRTGLRTIEAARANVEDVVFKHGKRILLIHGKGREEKDTFVQLTPKTWQPIEAYLKQRNAKDNEPLFTSTSNNNEGGKLTTRSISRIAKKALVGIGLDHKNYTAHSLRHTAAVSMLRANATDKDVQLALRHSNPATTQIYTESLNEERRFKHSAAALLDNLF